MDHSVQKTTPYRIVSILLLIVLAVLILCAAVQMGSRHRWEMTEAAAERQALLCGGLTHRQLKQLVSLRTAFTGLACFLLAVIGAGVMGSLSLPGFLAGIAGWAVQLAVSSR